MKPFNRLARHVVSGVLTLLISVGLIVPAAGAVAKAIHKCRTIKKAGYYLLKKSLTAKSGDCIDVTAANVTLSLNGKTIAGSGSGIGIHAMAANFFLDGLNSAQNNGTVINFAIGIQVDGNNSVLENFSADSNTDTGVLINGASSTEIGVCSMNSNTKNRLHLLNATATTNHNCGISSNGIYGVWVDSSTNSLLVDGRASNNGDSGFFLGCSSGGPGGTCVSSTVTPSSFNIVEHFTIDSNGAYGVAIDADDDSNHIDSDFIQSNTTLDTFDANPACLNNLWFDNSTHVGNSSCD